MEAFVSLGGLAIYPPLVKSSRIKRRIPDQWRTAGYAVSLRVDNGGSRSWKMCAEADSSNNQMQLGKRSSNRIPLPALMFVLPEGSVYDPDGLEKAVADAVQGGVNIVQIREPQSLYAALEPVAKRLTEKFPDVLVCVSSNIGVAANIERIGLHLPEVLGKFHNLARERTSETKTIGSSVHSVTAAEDALAGGSDYLVVGTIFETDTHPGKIPEGVLMLKMVRRAVGPEVPVIAIGGIKPENVKELINAGAQGIAVMTGLSAADNIKEAARKYRTALDEAWNARTKET